jgi:hypothetical protein
MSSFELVEKLLLQLLQASTPPFTSSNAAEVQNFIDVGEYGLALETTVDIYVEEHKAPNSEAIALMEQAAVAMGMDSKILLDKLTNPSRRDA